MQVEQVAPGGILLLNVVSFGLPFAAYMNPSISGGQTGPNLTVWLIAQTFWDGTMRAIFSMLFGTAPSFSSGVLKREGQASEPQTYITAASCG
jgi:uncharacterized protein